MVRNRPLKNPVINIHRIQKHLKDCLKESDNDRIEAEKLREYFKGLVQDNREDDVAKKCIIDAEKLVQSSRKQLLDIMELLFRVEKEKGAPLVSQSGETGIEELTYEEFMSKTADDEKDEE